LRRTTIAPTRRESVISHCKSKTAPESRRVSAMQKKSQRKASDTTQNQNHIAAARMLAVQDEVTRGVDIIARLKFLNALPTTLNQGS
jgi:hypothetical protein